MAQQRNVGRGARRYVTWSTLPGMDHTYGRFGEVVTTRILNVTVT